MHTAQFYNLCDAHRSKKTRVCVVSTWTIPDFPNAPWGGMLRRRVSLGVINRVAAHGNVVSIAMDGCMWLGDDNGMKRVNIRGLISVFDEDPRLGIRTVVYQNDDEVAGILREHNITLK